MKKKYWNRHRQTFLFMFAPGWPAFVERIDTKFVVWRLIVHHTGKARVYFVSHFRFWDIHQPGYHET